MFLREENLRDSLDGICVSCSAEKVKFRDEWVMEFLYKTGSCDSCGYDHHILVRKT